MLAERLSATLRHLVLLLRRAVAGQPVTSQQYAVLGSLERGCRRMSALAEEHAVHLPTMTVQINRMERDGLVTRGGDPADARVRTVALTEEGRECLRTVRRARRAFLAAQLKTLSPVERETLARALPILDRLGGS